ncbi:MAG TPA: hypothetical protein VNR42_02675, partial [Solirubrobacteraceae bacterium]|nr:hypothetical protein [Solirubrobacteraceae bacterium]
GVPNPRIIRLATPTPSPAPRPPDHPNRPPTGRDQPCPLDKRRDISEHPGSRPAALPGMTPLAGRPGVYHSLLQGEALVARRVPGAWLLVKGGPDLHQRLRLLTHLRAAVHLKSPRAHRRLHRRRSH